MKLLSDQASKKARGAFRKADSHLLLRVGFVLLMLGLIAFALYQLVSHVAVGLDTIRTQEILEQSYVSLDLYIFRDEEILPSEGELYQYHVSDGERVGVGDPIATAYTADGETEALQQLLNVYAQRIALSERMGSGGTVEDIDALKQSLDKAYLALLAASDEGQLDQAADAAARVQEGLRQYAVLTGNAEDTTETPAALKSAMAELVKGYPVSGQLNAERSGYVYYDTDGYEQLYDVDKVMTMTAEEFLALTEASPTAYEGAVAGKMVYSATWYAAAYVSLSEVTAFEVGESYEMICDDSMGTTVTMTAVRMEPTADGALLVFETRQMPDGFSFDRRISVQTVSNSISGYRIPTEALVTLTSSEGQETVGVYILAGNVVEFRKVHIRISRDGYIVVATYEEVQAMLAALSEEEQARLTADGWSYLKLNDKIITRGTGLYEGKMIS